MTEFSLFLIRTGSSCTLKFSKYFHCQHQYSNEHSVLFSFGDWESAMLYLVCISGGTWAWKKEVPEG
jgi:hypothetical protein